MKRSTLSAAGSVFTAIVASLCCIGPAILAVLGVGAVGFFSSFEPYRPYFLSLTVFLLGLAFYFTYKKKQVICEDGSCKIVNAGKWNRIGVWISSMIVLAAILFPYVSLAPAAGAAARSQQGAERQYSAVVLSIRGMDCEACANGLQASLLQMKGVKSAQVNYKSGTAVIKYDSTQVAPSAFTSFLARVGFKASIVETDLPAVSKSRAPAACPTCF
ncbi:MAG: mercuric transporter MerT family protein [Candidatus Kryptoniota bacterium]